MFEKTKALLKAGSGLVIRPAGQLVAGLTNLYQSPPDTIRGIDPGAYASPMQPISPIAPKGTEPRGFQWWAGQNMVFTPRPDGEYSAADLKILGAYPLARLCIENVKDQICRAQREFRRKPKKGETKKQLKDSADSDTTLKKLQDFFDSPDSEHDWSEWVRPLLEDMLVIDAPAILVRKTLKGEVAELRIIRGETIVRLIDANGYTPLPPSPAYQQVWWGIPLVNLTTDQLIYKPRNIVPRNTMTSQMYGMSPTEQLAEEITIGIKRLEFVKAYYTEGSTPGVVHVVPKGTPPDKISETMLWMNSELAGNLAGRRQWRMIPGFNEPGKPDQIEYTKEPLLTDPFDEMHIRKVCFGYGTSPQRLMRMMGTRNADAQQEASIEEGLLPWLDWLKGVHDFIIQRKMGLPDYEVVFNPFRETDPVKEADAAKTYVSSGLRTINEQRELLGDDPRKEAEADMLGVITGKGFIPITGEGALTTPAPQPDPKELLDGTRGAAPKPAEGKKPGGKPPAGKPPNGKDTTGKAHCAEHKSGYDDACTDCADAESRRIEKAAPPITRNAIAPTKLKGTLGFSPQTGLVTKVNPLLTGTIIFEKKHKIRAGKIAPSSIDAGQRIQKHVHAAFKRMEKKAVKVMGAHVKKMQKADLDTDKLLRQILSDIGIEYAALPQAIREDLKQAALTGVARGITQVEVTDTALVESINELARDWAEDRAAELVGMKWSDDGVLIENPDARWAISDTTRDDLRMIIRDVFAEESPSMQDVIERIQQAGTFSEERAEMIAQTEIIRAEVVGNLEAWRESDVVETVDWVLSDDHDLDDECDEAADGGPYDIDDVPDFPAHPRCECVLMVNTLKESGE